ncbi:MAG: hypothetical protein CW336_04035 [Bacteroidetes bacterium]|nr:hypothetical protein [Bacteroidota bacterium]
MKILYVSKDGLPDCAAGMRVDAVSKVFESSGHIVDVLSEKYISYHIDNAVLCDNDVLLSYNGRHYYFSKDYTRKNKVIQYLAFLIELLFAVQVYRRIKFHINKDRYQAIILYNESFILTHKLHRLCKKNKLKLICDVTEWYEKVNQIKHFEQIIRPRSVNRRIIHLDPKLDGIIAISPFLYKYYQQKGVNVVLVPPIIDSFLKPSIRKSNEGIRLVYAGSPGEKDLLLPLIIAVNKYNYTFGLTFKLLLIGVNDEYVSQLVGDKLELYGVEAYGKLPHEKCLKIISDSDFGVLLRRPLRYAKAGFSTKFAEAMSLGVPMICNRVGGCDELIEDGKDGFIIKDAEINTIYVFLCYLRDLYKNDELIFSIKNNAFNKAKFYFSSDRYVEELNNFING